MVIQILRIFMKTFNQLIERGLCFVKGNWKFSSFFFFFFSFFFIYSTCGFYLTNITHLQLLLMSRWLIIQTFLKLPRKLGQSASMIVFFFLFFFFFFFFLCLRETLKLQLSTECFVVIITGSFSWFGHRGLYSCSVFQASRAHPSVGLWLI